MCGQKKACRQKRQMSLRCVRETKIMLKFRLADHCGYVRNQTLDKATGEHFSLPGHILSDLTITVIEQSKRNNNLYRKEREEYHINRFNTFYKSLNKKKQWWGGLALYCLHNCR